MNKASIFKSNNLAFWKHPWFLLSALYAFSVVLRFVLALFFRHGPTISIDENLYINIAKSLAAGEGITYRSQPVPYMYIFYPLMLVPLYLIPHLNLYRSIQLYNAFLISISIFPVFLFSRDFTKSNRKALLASLFTLLMPDLQMAGYLMAESVVWPLTLWLVFFAYGIYTSTDRVISNGLLTGFFTALLFWTKPGAAMIGIVFLIGVFFLPHNQNDHKTRRLACLSGLGFLAVCILFFYVLYIKVFKYPFSFLGLYNKQLTSINIKWFIAVVEDTFLQLLLFAIACGGIFFILPYIHFTNYDNPQKDFILVFSAGLLLCALGTASLVDMYMWNGSFSNPALHLRYMAMFVPVMLAFSLGAPGAFTKGSKNFYVPVVVLAFLAVFPGASVGFVRDETTSIDSLALSAYVKSPRVPAFSGFLLTVLLVSSLLIVCVILYRRSSFQICVHFSCFVFLIFLLLNNVCGYLEGNLPVDNITEDALEINEFLENTPQEVLIITQQNYNEAHSHWLEVYLRKPEQQVTAYNFIEALSETGGIYHPFIPVDQDPNVNNHETPATDTFIFGATVADMVEFNSAVNIQSTRDGWYTIAQAPAGERIVDTALQGINLFFLPEGIEAKLHVFNSNRYHDGELTLYIMAGVEEGISSNLDIRNAGKTISIPLTTDFSVYEIPLEMGDTSINARGGEAVILSYWTE